MTQRDRKLMTAAAIVSALALVLASLAGHVELIAYAAPLIVLALPLLGGRYVGEERLARLAGRAARRRRPRGPAAIAPRHARTTSFAARGGRLIADSLAVRPPPGSALS